MVSEPSLSLLLFKTFKITVIESVFHSHSTARLKLIQTICTASWRRKKGNRNTYCVWFDWQVSKKYDIRDQLQELLDRDDTETISREQNADSLLSSWSTQDKEQEDMEASSDASFRSISASPGSHAGEGEGRNMNEQSRE